VVGLVSPNVPEFAVVFFAVASIGAICSTVNPVATAEEIGAQFADSEAVMLVTVPELLDKCATAARLASTVRELVVFGEAEGATPFASLLTHGDAPALVAIDPARDVCVLPYSSGTSGVPKGVMLTHRNLVANLCQMREPVRMVTESDTLLGVLPFFHIYGMVVILGNALREGATLVSVPRFDLTQVLEIMQRHRITFAHLVPPIMLALAKHPIVDAYDLSSVQTLTSGAAPLGASLAEACATRLRCRVRQGYGLTETSPVTHLHPIDSDVLHGGWVGPAVPNTTCRLVDPATGDDVPTGERGELWVRGPQVMLGYWNKPEATATCMTNDGWFKTGDVAVMDEQGWFTIVDRVKELIKYKGLQVAPAELEAVLLSNPAIADAAVIPVPDDEAGEIPKAYVVARSPIDADAVMRSWPNACRRTSGYGRWSSWTRFRSRRRGRFCGDCWWNRSARGPSAASRAVRRRRRAACTAARRTGIAGPAPRSRPPSRRWGRSTGVASRRRRPAAPSRSGRRACTRWDRR
jgi:acyl-CoA synthetase (AMP-forming)/AMP-acid ligase II